MSLPVALQLYTVRDELAKDFSGTLKHVADIGFKYVEFAGFYNHSPKQVRELCDKLGLKVSSAHVGIDALQSNLPGEIEAARIVGYSYLICPWIGSEHRTLEGYQVLAKAFDKIGKQVTDAGMTFCYHNHSFEWEKLADGSCGMDIIFNQTNPKYVHSELDVYWVQHGGDKPVDWMNKFKNRVPLLHIKDMNPQTRAFTEVATGCVDIKAVVQAASGVGAKYLVVEQDSNWTGSPLQSVRTSHANLLKIMGN